MIDNIRCSKCKAVMRESNPMGSRSQPALTCREPGCGGLPELWEPFPQFPEGAEVRYVPYHAHGDCAHPDCELGRVTSKNHRFVFVLFTHPRVRHWPQACNVDQLIRTMIPKGDSDETAT